MTGIQLDSGTIRVVPSMKFNPECSSARRFAISRRIGASLQGFFFFPKRRQLFHEIGASGDQVIGVVERESNYARSVFTGCWELMPRASREADDGERVSGNDIEGATVIRISIGVAGIWANVKVAVPEYQQMSPSGVPVELLFCAAREEHVVEACWELRFGGTENPGREVTSEVGICEGGIHWEVRD